MSESGECLAICCVVLCEVLAGFCYDLASIRHSFAERCCSRRNARADGDMESRADDSERAPLIREPGEQPKMQIARSEPRTQSQGV